MILALPLILSLPSSAGAAAKYTLLPESNLSPAMLDQLLAKGMLMLISENPDGSLQLITSGILINKSPQEVYNVMTDFDHYKDFMPSTQEVQILKKSGNVWDIHYKIKFAFSILSYSVEYVLTTTLDPIKGMKWDLKEGDIAKAYGSWEFIPVGDGSKTAAIYSVYSDIRSIGKVVRYFIEKEPSMDIAINASTCALVLKAVKKRVEQVPAATK